MTIGAITTTLWWGSSWCTFGSLANCVPSLEATLPPSPKIFSGITDTNCHSPRLIFPSQHFVTPPPTTTTTTTPMKLLILWVNKNSSQLILFVRGFYRCWGRQLSICYTRITISFSFCRKSNADVTCVGRDNYPELEMLYKMEGSRHIRF